MLVLGSGTIGAVILQTLKLKGCRVICADINDASLARAKEYGADAIVNTKTKSLKEAVQEFTDGAGVDVIFDSACYPGSLTAVLEMGIPANGATIVPMGFCTAQEGITQAMITPGSCPSSHPHVLQPVPAHHRALCQARVPTGRHGEPLYPLQPGGTGL